MTPPYVFGSAAVRWRNGIRFLSQVLDGAYPTQLHNSPKIYTELGTASCSELANLSP